MFLRLLDRLKSGSGRQRLGAGTTWANGRGKKPTSKPASRKAVASWAYLLFAERTSGGSGFIPYIRANWARGFRPLRTYRDRSDRVFRSLDKLVALVRDEFRYSGEISLFVAGDAGLQRYRTLLPTDRGELQTDPNEQAVPDADAKDWPSPDDD